MGQSLPPSGWGDDALTQYLQAAYWNRWATFDNKRPQIKQLIDIDNCFAKIGQDWTNPVDLLVPQFFFRTHSAFRVSCEHAMAGQASDLYPVLRSCLEFAAYGLYIDRNDRLGEIWLRRHDDEEGLKAVKAEFKIQKIRDVISSKDKRLAEIFDELYQRCIDYGAHPNERALSISGKIEDKDGDKVISQQLLHGNGLILDFLLKTTAQVGVCALQIFQFSLAARFELLGVRYELSRLREGL